MIARLSPGGNRDVIATAALPPGPSTKCAGGTQPVGSGPRDSVATDDSRSPSEIQGESRTHDVDDDLARARVPDADSRSRAPASATCAGEAVSATGGRAGLAPADAGTSMSATSPMRAQRPIIGR